MKLFEYFNEIEILKDQILGCDELINFYETKKARLQKEYDKLMNAELIGGVNLENATKR